MGRRGRAPILVVDDDSATREGLAEFLTELGYSVLAREDGQGAMNLLVGGLEPALLIVDLGMPHLRGDELLKYMQADPELRLVPVLVVTGSPEQMGRAVADAVLTKPIDLVTLLAQVQRLMAKTRQTRRQPTD